MIVMLPCETLILLLCTLMSLMCRKHATRCHVYIPLLSRSVRMKKTALTTDILVKELSLEMYPETSRNAEPRKFNFYTMSGGKIYTKFFFYFGCFVKKKLNPWEVAFVQLTVVFLYLLGKILYPL